MVPFKGGCLVDECASVRECSIGPLGAVHVIDHLAEGATVAVLAISVVWSAMAKS